jgi:ubiquinone biosynthesis UbiH/UbiF/VisC/COQ6 family hydroxylase
MDVDVAIVGGGPVGAALAHALAGTGLVLALVEPRPPGALPAAGFDRRVYALSRQSRDFLEGIGVWARLETGRIAPVHAMHVFGDDGAARLQFDAYKSGVPELAAIVEESNLQQALATSLAGQDNLHALDTGCDRIRWRDNFAELELSDGRHVAARLVVAADGAESQLRAAAGIEATLHEYGQQGVVANFKTQQAHGGVARQWFRRGDVLALLPLPGNRVSMVWSTPDAHAAELLAMTTAGLGDAVTEASGHALGELEAMDAARGFPLRHLRASRLVAPRLALVGDAAHNVHPLAGQGLNLGFGDVQCLARTLAERGLEDDCGSNTLLRRYERSRREPILAMELVTGGLHALFANESPAVAALRNAGLRLTDRIAPLKRYLVKRALG